MVNIDFNDLRTTLLNKGIGHLGIGIVDDECSLVEAVKQAMNSPLLDTSIEGAENLLINTAVILPKTTKDTIGVGIMTLKKGHRPREGKERSKPHLYLL